MENNMKKCPLCSGKVDNFFTAFVVDMKESLVIARDTPAQVCFVCKEEWIVDEKASVLEEMVYEAKDKERMIEVVDYSLEKVV
jgi:YgiT-type zinc finger domain-containing protein